jgi:hypothetical protein
MWTDPADSRRVAQSCRNPVDRRREDGGGAAGGSIGPAQQSVDRGADPRAADTGAAVGNTGTAFAVGVEPAACCHQPVVGQLARGGGVGLTCQELADFEGIREQIDAHLRVIAGVIRANLDRWS